jgi:methionyl-tRNA synthetase
MTDNIFITTTLPYCNGSIHVGAAFEFILADAFNRWFKLNGKKSFLNIGLDQTGSKILAKSKELGIPVGEYIKNISIDWKKACEKLNIEYDNFYETYTEEHADKVKKYWDIFLKNGDIYEKEYNGKYCVGCESFKLGKDLVDGKCQDHPSTEIQIINEKNFFFNLGKYKEQIIKWLESNPISESNKNELAKYLEDYTELSISRKKTEYTFDIEVPDRDDQVIYVWFSALLNYIFAAPDWENSTIIQLCGPDNLRFQAQIFQTFLSSLGKKNTDKLLVHGTILDKNGHKISKTLGNVIDPIEQLEKYGLEPVRYYALAGLNTYSNSSWNEDDLKNIWNAEIVNDWGNLLSRVLHLVDIKCNGKCNGVKSENFSNVVDDYQEDIKTLWFEFKVKDALQKTNSLVKYANKYINDVKPWVSDNYEIELANLLYLILAVNISYIPVFGYKKYNEISAAIEIGKKHILFNRI